MYSLESPVKKIEVGDEIKLFNETQILTNYEILEGEYTVYNLSEVETHHNYFANDVLVHNRQPVTPCFTFETPVKMWDNSLKKIGEIIKGDEVLSYRNGNYVKGVVTEQLIHPINSITEVVKYKSMIADMEHPYYDGKEWRPICEADGIEIDTQYVDNFYNLEIDGELLFESDHNFIVENFIVSGLGDNELLNKTFKRQPIFEFI